jgi:esterase/lipase
MPRLNSVIKIFGIMVVLVLAAYLTGLIPFTDSRFKASGSSAYLPEADDSFEFYLEENQRRIRSALNEHYFADSQSPFGESYSLEQVVQMRSPFEIMPQRESCNDASEGEATSTGGKGFLLIHGLSDSPYLLSPVSQSLSALYPCSPIRAVLIPGHATVPGDLINSDYRQWEQVVEYGISTFETEVEELFVVGYSNGSSLILNYLDQRRDDDFVSGLIFLSPGLKAKNALISLSPYMRYLMRWVNTEDDLDAVKYESFPMGAAAEFSKLGQLLLDPGFEPLDIPVLMVLSGDDTTIDGDTTVAFFCDKMSSNRRQLHWYRSVNTGTTPGVSCDGLNIQDVEIADPRFIGHSHVSITMPVSDPHYGQYGNYSSCLAYDDSPQRFDECRNNDSTTVYGENNIRDEDGFYQGKLVRRTTFNPLYDQMIESINCFVDGSC